MGGSIVRVAVGTSNPMKVRAAEIVFKAFMNARVVGVRVETGVGLQPAGVRNVLLGALRRAVDSLRGTGADYGVGVEAGPIEFPSSTGFLETQVAVVVDRGCRAGVGLSPSFELEKHVVEAMIVGVELERVAGVERHVPLGEGIGFIGVATRGFITRLDLTVQAIAMALVPFIAGYRGLISVEDLAAQVDAELECGLA